MAEEGAISDVAEILRQMSDASSRGDLDAFTGPFARDAVFLTGVGRSEGRDAIRGYIEGSAPRSNPSHKPISAAAAFSLPSAKQCVSHREFTIHVRKLRGITWVSAVIKINHKRIKTLGRAHITALVNLVGLPKGTFVLSITAKASNGQSAAGTRTYHTCAPKSKSHYAAPKL